MINKQTQSNDKKNIGIIASACMNETTLTVLDLNMFKLCKKKKKKELDILFYFRSSS